MCELGLYSVFGMGYCVEEWGVFRVLGYWVGVGVGVWLC